MSNSTTNPAPRFERGQRVRIIANEGGLYAVHIGVVGVIERADRMVRGIRRYQVLFEDPQTGGRRATRLREEHLLRAETSAEPESAPSVETAYVERSDGELVKREQIVLFPPMPASAPQPPTAPSAEQVSYSMQALAALSATPERCDPYEFAVALVRDRLEAGMSRDAILAWQSGQQWIYTVGGGTCYDVTRGGFYLTTIVGRKCSIRYALKTLVADAERRIAGVPRQVGLWGSEVRA